MPVRVADHFVLLNVVTKVEKVKIIQIIKTLAGRIVMNVVVGSTAITTENIAVKDVIQTTGKG